VLACLLALPLFGLRPAGDLEDVHPGQWVRAEGRTLADGTFIVSALEVRDVDELASLVGQVTAVSADSAGFTLLGAEVAVSARTRWEDDLTPATLLGKHVKVEGHPADPRRFTALNVNERRPGPDRIEGTVERITRASVGAELIVASRQLLSPLDVEVTFARSLAQAHHELRAGHWVRVKGRYVGDATFVGDEVLVQEPEAAEILIGAAGPVGPDQRSFELLGHRVTVSSRTKWKQGLSLGVVPGRRVRVEGRLTGDGTLAADEVKPDDTIRDRIEGRVDRLTVVASGAALDMLALRVMLPLDAEVVHDRALQDYPLTEDTGGTVFRDADDLDPGDIRLTDTLTFGGRLEWQSEWRRDYDFNEPDDDDQYRREITLRGELLWQPQDAFYGLFGFQQEDRIRYREEHPTRRDSPGAIRELFGYWRDPFDAGVDLQVGRQDFDEPREWLWDDDLDAVRAHWNLADDARLELSYSTLIADGNYRDKNTDNIIAYFSNGDWDRHLAAYVVDRRDAADDLDQPLLVGVRGLGEWWPDHESWVELAVVRGETPEADLRGYGYDVGTTWKPARLDPVFVTVGFAHGSGDPDPFDDVDESFRQTGLQDNTDDLGGETAFKYYGELLAPELSNMSIATVGLGLRLGEDNSAYLVWHSYRQDEPSTTLLDTKLKADPDGIHRDLGDALELILGLSRWNPWDIEIVLSHFDPGSAFGLNDDDAWFAKLQARYRF
jgi:hypothetical protein